MLGILDLPVEVLMQILQGTCKARAVCRAFRDCTEPKYLWLPSDDGTYDYRTLLGEFERLASGCRGLQRIKTFGEVTSEVCHMMLRLDKIHGYTWCALSAELSRGKLPASQNMFICNTASINLFQPDNLRVLTLQNPLDVKAIKCKQMLRAEIKFASFRKLLFVEYVTLHREINNITGMELDAAHHGYTVPEVQLCISSATYTALLAAGWKIRCPYKIM